MSNVEMIMAPEVDLPAPREWTDEQGIALRLWIVGGHALPSGALVIDRG